MHFSGVFSTFYLPNFLHSEDGLVGHRLPRQKLALAELSGGLAVALPVFVKGKNIAPSDVKVFAGKVSLCLL